VITSKKKRVKRGKRLRQGPKRTETTNNYLGIPKLLGGTLAPNAQQEREGGNGQTEKGGREGGGATRKKGIFSSRVDCWSLVNESSRIWERVSFSK